MPSPTTDTIPDAVAPPLLHGRLALVTGAGQGNGRSIALGLARAGARVLVTDVDAQTARDTADHIRAQGGAAWDAMLDVTSAQDCQTLAQRTQADVGAVDVLVNNAGIIIRADSSSSEAAQNWKKTLDVNVHGTFNVTTAFLPALRATCGTIINVASIAAYTGQAQALGYAPSKGAVKLYTQSLAAELAPHGVRVNAIAPGVIATPMTAVTRENPKLLASFMARIPMGRVGEPEDLIGPVVFLASDMARYVTGVTLPVDGGFLAV